MRGKGVVTLLVPPATEPLKTGDQYVVKVGRLLRVRCRVLESSFADVTPSDSQAMVLEGVGVGVGGFVRARFRFTVFAGEDGVIRARAQEKIISVPWLAPSKETLENEHRHTLSELDESFRSPSPA